VEGLKPHDEMIIVLHRNGFSWQDPRKKT